MGSTTRIDSCLHQTLHFRLSQLTLFSLRILVRMGYYGLHLWTLLVLVQITPRLHQQTLHVSEFLCKQFTADSSWKKVIRVPLQTG